MSDLIKEILETTTYRPVDVEAMLDPDAPSWCSFDPEIGYFPRSIVLKDGMDFCRTTYTYEPAGHRKMVNYATQPCRINTYGDSFTQCQQVSDDESWQERLAAHFGEPIRNYGIGGHSVFTAYKRAMRVEAGDCSAEYLLLTIYDDDHVRNLDSSRWIRTQWIDRARPRERAWPLHGLPWSHLRYDLSKGGFVEVPGLCRDAGELRKLCAPDYFYTTFHDDQIVRLFALEMGGEARFDDLEEVAEALALKVDLRAAPNLAAEAAKLRLRYGLKSSEFVMDKLVSWAEKNHKKLFVALAYSEAQIIHFLKGGERFDTSFIDYLERKKIPWFDSLQKHKQDYADFVISPEKYIDRYYIKPAAAAVFGHYNPLGNTFFAFAMKADLMNWLDPRPPAYRS
ncbi:MAG: hypothetical protein WCE68_00995 [Anaerolineales bacterium]